MKVFISWSGDRSKQIAILLSDWIKCVIQATRPWISTRDIDRGALWFSEIGDALKDTTVGIVCLTQENKNKPWILFETGALAKGLSSSRVCTFLIDLTPSDLEDPLAQFNHTLPNKDGMWQLVRTLNSGLGDGGLDERILEQVFGTYWAQFEERFAQLLKSVPSAGKPEKRSDDSLLAEILDNTRFLAGRIRTLESKVEREGVQDRAFGGWVPPDADVTVSSRAGRQQLREDFIDMAARGLPLRPIIEALSAKYGLSFQTVRMSVRDLASELTRPKNSSGDVGSTGK